MVPCVNDPINRRRPFIVRYRAAHTTGEPLQLATLRAESGLTLPDCCALDTALRTRSPLATFDGTVWRAGQERYLTVMSELDPSRGSSIKPDEEAPMHWMLWVVLTLGVVSLLDRLAVFAEKRGWIYWRRRGASGGGHAGVLGGLAEAFHPAREHTIEQAQDKSIGIDEDHSGRTPS